MIAVLNRDRALASVSCSIDKPVMYEIYEGTSGSTHGETNESKPAENAAINEIWVSDCVTDYLESETSRFHQHLDQLVRFGSLPVAGAEDLLPHDPLPIDHERHRQRPCSVRQADAKIRIVKDGKVNLFSS